MTTQTMEDKVQSMNLTARRLASLQEGQTVRLASGEGSVAVPYKFIGTRGSNELRFARRKAANSITRVSLSPLDVSLCADGVYRGSFIEAEIVKGESTSYNEYDKMLTQFRDDVSLGRFGI